MPEKFSTVEALGDHLRSAHHRVTDYASMACDEWARGSAICPFCDLFDEGPPTPARPYGRGSRPVK